MDIYLVTGFIGILVSIAGIASEPSKLASDLSKGEALVQKCEFSKSSGDMKSTYFYYESSGLGQRILADDSSSAILISGLGHLGQISQDKDAKGVVKEAVGSFAVIRFFINELKTKYELLQRIAGASPTAHKFIELWKRDATQLKLSSVPLSMKYSVLPSRSADGQLAASITSSFMFEDLLAFVVRQVPLAMPPFPMFFYGSEPSQGVSVTQDWWEEPYFPKNIRWEQKELKWWASLTCESPKKKAVPNHFATIEEMNKKLETKDGDGDLSPNITAMRDSIPMSAILMTPISKLSKDSKDSAQGLMTQRLVSGLCLTSLTQIDKNLSNSTCNQKNIKLEVASAAENGWTSTQKELTLQLVKATVMAFGPKNGDVKSVDSDVTASYHETMLKICKPLILEGGRSLAEAKCKSAKEKTY